MTDQELNEAVARKLGWYEKELDLSSPWNSKAGKHKVLFNPKTGNGGMIPAYATSIEAAWEILAKYEWEMKTTKYGIDIRIYDETNEYPAAVAPTAPRAICEAFLKLP